MLIVLLFFMKPGLKYKLEIMIESHLGYCSDKVNKQAVIKIIVEDILRIIKNHFIKILK